MDPDTAKLQNISRDLSQLGIELSHRTQPIDDTCCKEVGQAFIALSEAIADISAALARGAATTPVP